jgi:threonine/homoserine/homoserine lactone efflux protein
MDLNYFAKGCLLGFAIAAPVGPIGILCIRRSIAHGRLIGLATGLGAATADAAYGCIAAFGITAVSSVLVGQRFWLGIFGGGFLCYLAIRIFIARPPENVAAASRASAWPAYGSALALTLTNPTTILSFAAIFAGFDLGKRSAGHGAATALVGGVFIGSAVWWLILSSCAGSLHSRSGTAWMPWINRLSGVLLFAFGIYALFAAGKSAMVNN